MYAVRVGEFEGPLDLLLGLIEERKLSINDISLSEITEQYLQYLKKFENFPADEVAFFVVIAATLILIKSRSLMPTTEFTQEEVQSIEELEGRLKLYAKFRHLAVHLKEIFGENILFDREGFRGMEVDFMEPRGVNKEILQKTLKGIVEKFPVKDCLPEAQVKKIISMEEKIKELTESIQNKFEVYFSEFSTSRNDIKGEKKIEIIVSFLAMLELVKQGIVMVSQSSDFENIKICSANNNHNHE